MIHALSSTPHGRLLSLAITVALAGGGVSALIHDPMGIALMCVSLLGAVVLTLTAIALSIAEDMSFGVLAAVVLPLLFFLYAVGLQVAIHNHSAMGPYAFIGLGALFAINALRGGKSTRAEHTGHTAAAH